MALKIVKATTAKTKEQLKFLASQAFDRGDLVAAGKHLMEALEQDPKDANLFLQVAFVRMKQGEGKKAVIAATQAILLAQHPDAYNFMGVLLFEMKSYGAAEQFFRRVLELDPDHAGAKESLLDAIRMHQEHGDDEPSESLDAVLKLLELKGPTLSLCMIVKNEEPFLDDCLNSVRGVVDEIVVVDTGSTDNTIQIARAHGARVLHFEWCDDFARARNVALDAASGDWILVLDADEEIDPQTKKELRKLITDKSKVGYGLLLENKLGNGLNGVQTAIITRLFQNRPDVRYEGIIHEQVVNAMARTGMPTPPCGVRIIHKGYTDATMTAKDKFHRNLTLLERQVAEHPEMSYAHFNLGQTYKVMNDHARAEAPFREALRLLEAENAPRDLPYYPATYQGLADSLRGQERLDEAVAVIDEALGLWPTYPDLNYLKGYVLLAQNRPEQALGCFQKCRNTASQQIFMSGNDPDVQTYKSANAIAACYAKMDKKALAREYTLKAINECTRKTAEPTMNMAILLMQDKKFAEALSYHAKALEIEEDHAPAWHGMGCCLFELGQFVDAIQAFEKAIEKASDLPHSRYLAGEAQLKLGRLDEAQQAFEGELARDAEMAPAHYKLGLCRLVAGDAEGALRIWNTRRSGAKDEAAKLASGVLLASKLREGGIPTAEEISAVGLPLAAIASLWAEYFEVSLRSKQLSLLPQLLDWAQSLAPAGFPQLACELGGVYLQFNVPDSALELLLRAQPHLDSAELYYRLGKAAAAKSLIEDAQLMFGECLRRDPRHPRAGLELAELRKKASLAKLPNPAAPAALPA